MTNNERRVDSVTHHERRLASTYRPYRRDCALLAGSRSSTLGSSRLPEPSARVIMTVGVGLSRVMLCKGPQHKADGISSSIASASIVLTSSPTTIRLDPTSIPPPTIISPRTTRYRYDPLQYTTVHRTMLALKRGALSLVLCVIVTLTLTVILSNLPASFVKAAPLPVTNASDALEVRIPNHRPSMNSCLLDIPLQTRLRHNHNACYNVHDRNCVLSDGGVEVHLPAEPIDEAPLTVVHNHTTKTNDIDHAIIEDVGKPVKEGDAEERDVVTVEEVSRSRSLQGPCRGLLTPSRRLARADHGT